MTLPSDLITPEFIDLIRAHYQLKWEGLHGFAHWQRVRENGLKLASLNGANPNIIEYFAFTHDSRRQNDGFDLEHGPRAAQFIRDVLAPLIRLDENDLELLIQACAGHTKSQVHDDLTVMTCWDADRLDLYRIGIRPNPQYLCTEAARDPQIIEWAMQRSEWKGRPKRPD
jgi:uncharacterized protein